MGLSIQDATSIVTDNGLRTPYGLILPPGARVAAYVRSGGIQTGDDPFLAANLVTTLAAGLARVRAGFGDFVVCLPGHVENVVDGTTFSAALLAGTKIIGVGKGSNTPTFTFTAAGSQWLVAVNDVVITGLKLQANATTNVGTAISVTGNDFAFYFNEFVTSNGSFAILNAIIVSSTASRFDISGNVFRSAATAAGASATCIHLTGTGDSGRICDNEMLVATFTTNGPINVAAANTNLKILRNVVNNLTALSISGITFANVAITGHCAYNTITVLSTGAFSAGVTGITVGGTNNLTGFFQNFAVNDPNKSGLLVPAVDT